VRRLPLADGAPAPTIEAMRARLGGRRKGGGDREGTPVQLDDLSPPGVILYTEEDSCDVYLGEGRVKRVARARCQELPDVPEALRRVAEDVVAFAALPEGGRVRFVVTGGAAAEGVLVEKCRYGALIEREDGVVVAVGFRRVLGPRGALH
jgi:hypothetical protein